VPRSGRSDRRPGQDGYALLDRGHPPLSRDDRALDLRQFANDVVPASY
jgi:hypothetical protein